MKKKWSAKITTNTCQQPWNSTYILVAEFAEKESYARKMLEEEMKKNVAAKRRLENRIAAIEERLLYSIF